LRARRSEAAFAGLDDADTLEDTAALEAEDGEAEAAEEETDFFDLALDGFIGRKRSWSISDAKRRLGAPAKKKKPQDRRR